MNELDEHQIALLKARAEALAQRGRLEQRRRFDEPVAVVLVGGEKMGLPVTHLRSVIRVPSITEIVGMPTWLAGVVQVRGMLLTVIDLARWLELPNASPHQYLALLEVDRRPLGLLVEAVAGVRDVYTDDVVEQRVALETGNLPVRYTTRDLVAVLDLERLFAQVNLRRNQSTADPRHPTSGAHS
jgi:chemotaxis signal transduction protein